MPAYFEAREFPRCGHTVDGPLIHIEQPGYFSNGEGGRRHLACSAAVAVRRTGRVYTVPGRARQEGSVECSKVHIDPFVS